MSLYGIPYEARLGPVLARTWWLIALRGLVAIGFGVFAFASPLLTVAALVFLFAAYLFADGVVALIAGIFAMIGHRHWGLLILEGVANLVAGVAAFFLPGLAVLVVVLWLAIWAVVSGVLLVMAALRLPKSHGRWVMLLCGLVSAVWGVVLFAAPAAGAVVLTWWLGGYAIVFGLAMLVLSLQLRRRHVSPVHETAFGRP